MAKVRVMYWKEIPIQVQAEDAKETISIELEPRFQQAADAISMLDGSAGSDEYLDGWNWGEYFDLKSLNIYDQGSLVLKRTWAEPGIPKDDILFPGDPKQVIIGPYSSAD